MACQKTKKSCNCDFNIKSFGLCDPKRVTINGADRTVLNWSEISVPEILCVPEAKPDIENLDQIYATAELTSVKLIETPFAYKIVNRAATTGTGGTSELELFQDIIDAANALFGAGSLTEDLVDAITALTGAVNIALLLPVVTDAQKAAASLYITASTAVTDILDQLEVLLSTIATPVLNPKLASFLCTTLLAIQNLLNSLITALANLTTALITLASAFTGSTIVTGLLITAVTTAINALYNPNVTPPTGAVATLLNSIISLLDSLGATSYLVIIPNEEGTCLTGRKLVIEGFLNQKVVYTGEVETQSVHSAHYSVPFSAFVIPYAKFEGISDSDYVYEETITIITPDGTNTTTTTVTGFGFSCTDVDIDNIMPDLCEEFCVDTYIEDIFATALDPRTIFKNVTLFFLAKPSLC